MQEAGLVYGKPQPPVLPSPEGEGLALGDPAVLLCSAAAHLQHMPRLAALGALEFAPQAAVCARDRRQKRAGIRVSKRVSPHFALGPATARCLRPLHTWLASRGVALKGCVCRRQRGRMRAPAAQHHTAPHAVAPVRNPASSPRWSPGTCIGGQTTSTRVCHRIVLGRGERGSSSRPRVRLHLTHRQASTRPSATGGWVLHQLPLLIRLYPICAVASVQ